MFTKPSWVRRGEILRLGIFVSERKMQSGLTSLKRPLNFWIAAARAKPRHIPRKKLHGGLGGMGRPASSTIGKVRFEDEWVDWEWFLVLANVFHLGLALKFWG